VQFTLHGKDDEPRTIELLRSKKMDNPSFGAVKVKLPINAAVSSKDSRLVVDKVEQGGNAYYSQIRQGDIIRAVSLPEAQDTQADEPWWARLGQSAVPDAEKGMAILDGKPVGAFNAALRENIRVNGQQGQVVLIIERPVMASNDDDGESFYGGFRSGVDQEAVALGLVPIPVRVEEERPGQPPRFPGPMRSTNLNSVWSARTAEALSEEWTSTGVARGSWAALLAVLFFAVGSGALFTRRQFFPRRDVSLPGAEPLLSAA
jgi:hypothetical protein